MDKSLLTTIPEGDNRELVDSDFNLEDYGEDILPKIALMPKLDMVIKHYSQYDDEISHTGCTIAEGINMFATINNYDFTHEQRLAIYDFAISRGRKPGSGRPRGSGIYTVCKWRNTQFPNDKAILFATSLFSDEFNAVMDKLGIASISIKVDSKYWKDVKDNLVLDGYEFALTSGHATTMMKPENYICIDSIPRDYVKGIHMPMIYEFGDKERVDILIDNHNLRNDSHIILMERWLKEKDPKEIARLTEYKAELEQAILLNSKMRNLTNSDVEKKERNRQNNRNRGKLAVINAFLG